MSVSPQQFPEITELTVAAARRGDHAAIGELAGDAYRRIVAFYRYTGVKPDIAEDLAADAVETIIARLPSLRKPARYDAWMWSIARNRLRDHWRVRRRGDALEPVQPSDPGPEELAILHEEHAAIRAAIRTLSLRDQELLWLREVLGLDYRAVANRMDMSAASARVACHRARKNLQAAYDLQLDEGESA